jgi:hypothetical protein
MAEEVRTAATDGPETLRVLAHPTHTWLLRKTITLKLLAVGSFN